ncbi:MAG TPA: alpha/beta hydrolase family protein [Chthoniobacteraceae bacterium]|jgi:S-formylglutathione hydrolase FrmB|nr:alpha/beta hydrolase family protein [Chthoniobacteraceae bacterium]
MAFLDVHAFSDVLALQVTFQVLLPQQTSQQIGVDSGSARPFYPVLWLLHGLSDDHTIWLRRTSVERYAAAKNLAVVMPAAGRSFYQDMVSGPRYWTFLTEELPSLCRSWFPLSIKREDNFVAGLSMGGYGALRMALALPERYAAAASLSGALDISRRLREAGKEGSRISRAEWESIFGPDLRAESTSADLDFLAEGAAQRGDRPRIFLSCGTEDDLLRDSRQFRDRLTQLNYAHTYEESPGGHEWGYWDAAIQRVVEWLPLA